MYPSTARRDAGTRKNSERNALKRAYREDASENRLGGTTFLGLITFPNLRLPLLFFPFCHIMRLGVTGVISVSALGPTHVLPGARDAVREGSANYSQNAERVLRKRNFSWK